MSFWAFTVILLSLLKLYCCIPQDLKPQNVLSVKETSSFTAVLTVNGPTERGPQLYDVQDLKFINDTLVIGARNAIFVVRRPKLLDSKRRTFFDQIVSWLPTGTSLCEKKTGSKRTCQNYIRLLQVTSKSTVLVCGTNASKPTCREYEWSGDGFTGSYQPTGKVIHNLLPQSDLSSAVYKYAEGNMFIATRNDLHSLKPVIARAEVLPPGTSSTRSFSSASSASLLPLKTQPDWLVDSRFAGVVESGDKLYVFFREEASEASNQIDKVVFPRVAQLCKRDVGGRYLLKQRWTSFFKARLNCSFPGARPFYFGELQHVTDAVRIDQDDVVFATITTPTISIPGSAVCAFTLRDISAAFNGSFWKSDFGSSCWKSPVPNPHPSACRHSVAAKLKKQEEVCISQHPIMKDAVPALGGRPLFSLTQTSTRLTAIAAEANVPTSNGNKVTLLYMGTNDGKLLKVVTTAASSNRSSTTKTTFSEEWTIFQNATCTRAPSDPTESRERDVKEVKSIALVPNSDVLLATFRYCVMRVPKHMCRWYTRKSACVESGNPYCGWIGDRCHPLNVKNRSPAEQDLFPVNPGEDHRKIKEKVQNECLDPKNIIVPLVVGLVGTFLLVMLFFFAFLRCRNKRKLGKSNGEKASARSKQESGSFTGKGKDAKSKVSFLKKKGWGGFSSRGDTTLRRSEEADMFTNFDAGYEGGLPELPKEDCVNPNVYVVDAIEDCGSTEDSTRGNDFAFAETDAQTPPRDETFRQTHPPESSSDQPLRMQHNVNNNKTVGVARPMAHHLPSKLSQIVHPTFVGKQASRVKLGSHQTPWYGSTLREDPLLQPRIVTNPNYLPLSPCISRVVPEVQRAAETKSASGFLLSASESGDRLSSGDSFFPDPPDCVLFSDRTPASESEPYDWSPSLQVERLGSIEEVESDGKVPEAEKSKRRHSNRVSSSVSEESTTSGFFSSSVDSPQTSSRTASDVSRKGLIVAKGILSVQSDAPLKVTKKNKRKSKDVKPPPGEKYSVSQYDPGVLKRNSDIDQRDSMLDDDFWSKIPQRNPEFVVSSEEDLSPQQELSGNRKFKRSLKLFRGRKSKKENRNRVEGIRIADEDTFVSPSYDEEPFVPKVEGWQEIEYVSPGNLAESVVSPVMTSFHQQATDLDQQRPCDDTCVAMGTDESPSDNFYSFYTMRPKSRRRQRMQKMRNTDKEWALANNPMPVPTPEVPNPMQDGTG